MTVAVGNLGAKSEAAGQAGVAKSAGGALGNAPGTNWFKASSGNLATGLSSATPSFRSSWQALFNAWRGVSRGTNSINNLAEETGITTETTSTESVVTPNKLQVGFFAAESANVPTALTSARHNDPPQTTTTRIEDQIALSRSQCKPGQNAETVRPLETSAAPGATERSSATHRNRVDPRSTPQRTTNTAESTEPDQQSLPYQAAVIHGLPVRVVSLPVVAAPLSSAPISGQSAMRSETDETALVSEPDLALPKLHSAQIFAPAPFAPYEFGAIHVGRTSTGALNLDTNLASLSHSTAEGPAANKSLSSSYDALEPVADNMQSNGEATAPATQRESKTAGENPGAHSALVAQTVNGAIYESFASATTSAASDASTSDAEAIAVSAAPANNGVPGHLVQRAQAHDIGWENVATSVAAAQPVTSDAVDAALRTPPGMHHATAPVTSPAQGIAAASSATSALDTFAALDRETSLGTPMWTHAASQHAEAGFRDPDLGWVGVRANLNSSGIHATLVPSSAEAALTLTGHLAELASRLAEDRAPVASLSMASPGESTSDSGVGQRMQQGSDGNAAGNRPDQSTASLQESATIESSTSTSAATPESGISREMCAYTGELHGTRISVIA